MKRIATICLSVALVSGLSACGGGGGGDEGGGGGGGGSSDRPTLVIVGSNALTFTSRAPGIDAPAQQIGATISNVQSLNGSTVYILVTGSGSAVGNVSNVAINGFSGSAMVTPGSSSVLGSGTHTGTVTIRACKDSPNCASGELRGSPLTVSVTYTVGAFGRRHQLVANSTGVGLASVPGRSALTRTIGITDTLNHQVAWAASADQSWLNVTSAGVTPGNLVITANPSGLAPDTQYFANVTVTSGESGQTHSEVIRVGLWVGSQAPASPIIVDTPYEDVIADPLRPLVYAHTGQTSLYVHDVYTGALVATIPIGKRLGDMAVSGDGSRLFIGDHDSQGSSDITPVDLATRAVGTSWGLPRSGYLAHLELTRIDGAEVMLTGSGYIYNVATRALVGRFGDDFGRYNDTVAASRDGHAVCTLNRGLSPNTLRCYTVEFTDEGEDVAIFHLVGSSSPGSNGQDLAFSLDGTRVYAASGAPYVFASMPFHSPNSITYLPGTAYPTNVEIAPDGRLFAGAGDWYGPIDLWIYRPDGTEQSQMRVAGTQQDLEDDTLKLSGDGLRFVALDERTLRIFDTPPP